MRAVAEGLVFALAAAAQSAGFFAGGNIPLGVFHLNAAIDKIRSVFGCFDFRHFTSLIYYITVLPITIPAQTETLREFFIPLRGISTI